MGCLCGYVYASDGLFGLVWRCRMAPSSSTPGQLANHDGYGRALRTGRFTPNVGDRKSAASFDQLVGAGEQRRRNNEAQRLRRDRMTIETLTQSNWKTV